MPFTLFLLVDSRGNLLPAGIEYRADRQTGGGVLIGFCGQGADTDQGDAQAKGQSLGGADADP